LADRQDDRPSRRCEPLLLASIRAAMKAFWPKNKID
jgi:hypothetical protein